MAEFHPVPHWPVSLSQQAQQQDPENGSQRWNAAVVYVCFFCDGMSSCLLWKRSINPHTQTHTQPQTNPSRGSSSGPPPTHTSATGSLLFFKVTNFIYLIWLTFARVVLMATISCPFASAVAANKVSVVLWFVFPTRRRNVKWAAKISLFVTAFLALPQLLDVKLNSYLFKCDLIKKLINLKLHHWQCTIHMFNVYRLLVSRDVQE